MVFVNKWEKDKWLSDKVDKLGCWEKTFVFTKFIVPRQVTPVLNPSADKFVIVMIYK